MNAALGSTPLSSPLDSPDVLNTLVPLSDIGIASASIGSIKLPSMDSINLRNQQQHQHLHHQQQQQQQHHQHHQQQLHHSGAISQQHQVRLKNFRGGGGEEDTDSLADQRVERDSLIQDLLRQYEGGGKRSMALERSESFENLQRLASALAKRCCGNRHSQLTRMANSCSSQTNSPATCRRHFCSGGSGGSGIGGGGGGVGSCMGLTGDSITSLRSLPVAHRSLGTTIATTLRSYSANTSDNNSCTHLCSSGSSLNLPSNILSSMDSHQLESSCKCLTSIPEASVETANDSNYELKALLLRQQNNSNQLVLIDALEQSNQKITPKNTNNNKNNNDRKDVHLNSRKMKLNAHGGETKKLLEFSLSSVGRSFIDDDGEECNLLINDLRENFMNFSITTPETPTPNISPTKSIRRPQEQQMVAKDYDTFSNDFVQNTTLNSKQQAERTSSIPLACFGGSWDLLELDLEFHEVNSDPSFNADVEERIYHGETTQRVLSNNDDGEKKHVEVVNGNQDNNNEEDIEGILIDDPFGVLPMKPTPPDSLDL